MKFIFLLIISGVFVGGCTLTGLKASDIKPEETYQGYPCFQSCDEFALGFEAARSQKVRVRDKCDMDDLEVRSGCKAFVAEQDWRTHEKSDLYIK